MVKFLIIRFSSIGDIVLTSPLIRCLKNQVENAELHFLTKQQFESLVSANPYINKVHLLNRKFSELVRTLKNEEYHYIIDLHHNLRTFRLKNRLRILAFSFNKLNIQKWFLVNFKINKLPDIHIVDRYLDTIKLFDVKNDNKGLDFFIPDGEEVNIKSFPSEFHKGYIAMVVGAKHQTKQMNDGMMEEICRKIDYPMLLIGGKENYKTAENISRSRRNNILNTCGKFSIIQSASLIKQSQLVITPDTGMMHIAAAFRKKIISVWGNTVPEFGMYPYQAHPESKIIEVKGLKCRPCSKIGYNKCPKKHFKCINNIDVGEIIRTAKSWIES